MKIGDMVLPGQFPAETGIVNAWSVIWDEARPSRGGLILEVRQEGVVWDAIKKVRPSYVPEGKTFFVKGFGDGTFGVTPDGFSQLDVRMVGCGMSLYPSMEAVLLPLNRETVEMQDSSEQRVVHLGVHLGGWWFYEDHQQKFPGVDGFRRMRLRLQTSEEGVDSRLVEKRTDAEAKERDAKARFAATPENFYEACGSEIRTIVEAYVEKIFDEQSFDIVDRSGYFAENLRVARKGNAEEMCSFEYIEKKSGCTDTDTDNPCAEEEIVIGDEVVVVGYNYDHD